MKYKKSLFIIILAVLLSLTSCTGIFSDPTTLMKPPNAEGDFNGIEEALSTAIGEKFNFAYPSSGEYRSSCILKDIDRNGNEEAIVFYTLASDDSLIYMNYLCRINEKWKSTFNLQILGTGIDRIEFADLCGDGTLELLLGCNMYNTKEKQLSIYTLSHNKFNLSMQENYTEFFVCNLTSHIKPQVLLMTIGTVTENANVDVSDATVNKYANAKLISLSEGTDGITTVLGSVELDRNITAFSSISTAPMNDDFNAVYIDEYKGSEVMITELLYFDKKLINAFYSSSSDETSLTKREALINSRDINSDGYIEIPEAYLLPGFESADNSSEKAFYTIWKRYNGASFEKTSTGLINTTDGYFINTPETWLGSVTITRYLDEHLRIFSEWNLDKGTIGDELFRIKVFTKTAWSEGNNEGYIKITTDKSSVYAVKINKKNNSSYNLDYNYILKNFKIL